MNIFKTKCRMCGKRDCMNARPTSGNVGLGVPNPYLKLKITYKGSYGIGTTAPTSYIQLNADSLWDAWKKLIKFTFIYSRTRL